MKSGRFFAAICIFLPTILLQADGAAGFWGFGDDRGKSGLDFDGGYDLNTVTTVRGKVVSVVTDRDRGHVTLIVRQGSNEIRVIAAPEWYWSDRGIPIRPEDEIEATGAKAQGKDGGMYLISRKITNRTTGDSVTLRADTGRPVWRGGGGRAGGRGPAMRMQRRFGGGRRRR
jgi:hypothetical protein